MIESTKYIKSKKVCIYKCDRCNSIVESNEKRSIYVQKGTSNKKFKKYDFCKLCYIKFIKGVEKYAERML